jgi:hypothetical protein
MVKRERFVTPLTCPECALNGSANWEESERGDLETTIQDVSEGFSIGPDGEISLFERSFRQAILRRVPAL